MHTNTLRHLGLISPCVEQLWPKLSCFAVGSQRNAGRTALRAPTEGKLQGSAACRNSDENTGARVGVYDIFSLAGAVVPMEAHVGISLLLHSDVSAASWTAKRKCHSPVFNPPLHLWC